MTAAVVVLKADIMQVSDDDLQRAYQATGEITNLDPVSTIRDCEEMEC
jgi:hypothetical protein